MTGEVSVAPDGGFGFGPRHLDFHPAKPWVYVSLERQNRLDMFALDGEALSPEPRFSKGTLAEPGNIRGRQAAGTVHVHPNGRFVYVANRASSTVEEDGRRVFAGGENTLAVYAIDPRPASPTRSSMSTRAASTAAPFTSIRAGKSLSPHTSWGFRSRTARSIREVPAGLSVFRIGGDGKLDFVRKYDVEVGDRQMFWMGMV